MLNNKQRSRWLSEVVSEVQRYLSKSPDSPESGRVRQALSILADAKKIASQDEARVEDQS